MRRLFAASLIALGVLFSGAMPVSGGTPASYMAYQVRLLRNQGHYTLDRGLMRLAQKRAVEYALNPDRSAHPHRFLYEVPCAWGEILGWSTLDNPITAARWVASAWRKSPTHWSVLRSRWRFNGVGAYYRGGRWYFAVVFAQCRL